MLQQSGKYFHKKQDEFLLYLARKSRDQLIADLDDERFAALQPFFNSLFKMYPQFKGSSQIVNIQSLVFDYLFQKPILIIIEFVK
jgi:hypothetical protein